jgi:hypothetical protein
MEGFSLALAARRVRHRFLEIRTVSNPVGARDKRLWNFPLGTLRPAKHSPLPYRNTGMTPLRIAISPCPNDSFIFGAWVLGLTPPPRARLPLFLA